MKDKIFIVKRKRTYIEQNKTGIRWNVFEQLTCSVRVVLVVCYGKINLQ